MFVQFTQADPKSEMEMVFLFLRYWGLRHNRDMRNAIVFDGKHGVKAYLQKLKGALIRQLSLLSGASGNSLLSQVLCK